jgi:hypothetical protein
LSAGGVGVDTFAVDHVEPAVKHVRTGVDDLKLGQPCSHRLKYSSSKDLLLIPYWAAWLAVARLSAPQATTPPLLSS